MIGFLKIPKYNIKKNVLLCTTVSKDHTRNNDSCYNQSISLFGFVLNKLASMNFGVFIKTYWGV